MLRLAKTMRAYNIKVDLASNPQTMAVPARYFNIIREAEEEVVDGCRKMLKVLDFDLSGDQG